MNELISFIIAYGPTFIFILFLVAGLLWGFIRGFRKSIILFIQNLCLFLILVIIYINIINLPDLDTAIYGFADNVCSLFGHSLNSLLNVSSTNTTLTGALSEILENQLGYGNIISIIINGQASYLDSWVIFSYRVIIAVIFYMFYIILEFVFYIIYLIFYSERKFKKKTANLHYNGNLDYPYQKRRLLGGLVGFVRGFLTSFITLSFIGSIYYIIGGGIGVKNTTEVKLNDPTLNTIYGVYDDFSNYGDKGIFKILNVFKDSNDTPYYLFISDILFSTKYEVDGKLENVYFREELASYTNFIRNSLNLIGSYDKDLLTEILENGYTDEVNNKLVNVLINKDFQTEFKVLIADFEEGTYLINVSLEILTNYISNIDSLGNIDSETKELLNILFTGENAITLNDLVEAEDVKLALNLYLDILSVDTKDLDDEETSLAYAKVIIPSLEKLSLFSEPDKINSHNALFLDLFNHLTTSLIPSDMSLKSTLTEDEITDINWYQELISLITGADNLIYFINDIYNPVYETAMEDFLGFLFNNVYNNTYNEQVMTSVVNLLSNSKILTKFIKESGYIDLLIAGLETSYEINISPNVNLTNTYDEDGKLLSYGELYNLLEIIKNIAKNDVAKNAFYQLLSFDGSLENLEDILMSLDVLTYPSSNETILSSLANSDILNYILTSFITSDELKELSIYIPESTKDSEVIDNTLYVKIKKDDLRILLNDLPIILNILNNYNLENISINDFNLILEDERIYNVLTKDKIAEGTITNLFIKNISDESNLVLTETLKAVEYWLNGSEIKSLYNIINRTNLNLIDLLQEDLTIDDLLELNLSSNDINILLKSNLIYYNISNYLINEPDLVIPYDAYDRAIKDYLDGSAFYPIKKEELSYALNKGISLLNEDFNLYSIFNNLDALDSLIINATECYYLGNNLDNSIISMPEAYLEGLTKESLTKKGNIYLETNELRKLLEGIDAIYSIKNNPNFTLADINDDNIYNKFNMLNDYYDYRTRLDVIYESAILSYTLSTKLNDILVPDLLNNEYLACLLKDNIYNKEVIVDLVTVINQNGIYDLSNLDLDYINNIIDTANIYTLSSYYRSNLIAYIISSQVDKAVYAVDPSIKEISKYSNGKNIHAYLESEVLSLIKALKSIGFNNFNDFDEDIFTDIIKENYDIADIYQGNLIKGLVTTYLDEIISNNSLLATTSLAKEQLGESLVYKTNEIRLLGELLREFNLNIDNFELSAISLVSIEEYVLNSYLLNAIFTKNLNDNELIVIPKSIINDNTIDNKEIEVLFRALSSLGVKTLADFIDIKIISDLSLLTRSLIMRASITKNINDLNEKIYVESELVSKDIDYNGNDILILSEREILALGNCLSTNFEINIDLFYLYNHIYELDLLLESSIMHILISDILASFIEVNFKVNVYNLSNPSGLISYNILTKEDIEHFFGNI